MIYLESASECIPPVIKGGAHVQPRLKESYSV
jgi:hypothetical protein